MNISQITCHDFDLFQFTKTMHSHTFKGHICHCVLMYLLVLSVGAWQVKERHLNQNYISSNLLFREIIFSHIPSTGIFLKS